jgi:cell division protein FtsW (lipid II flippase)
MAGPSLETLPESHTDFLFSVTVESWWPLVVLLVIALVLVVLWRRRAS